MDSADVSRVISIIPPSEGQPRVVVSHFDEPRDLLMHLDLSRDEWSPTPGDKQQVIFRGQADVDWPLLPAAWRSSLHPLLRCVSVEEQTDLHTDWEDEEERIGLDGLGDAAIQTVREMRIVENFVELAADLGISLPPERPACWARWSSKDHVYANIEWDDSSELLGLAQHHGIPTRLLDWTWRPQFAAFWAAWQFVAGQKPVSEQARMVVWALTVPDVRYTLPVEIVELPRRYGMNLFAQDGLFTRVQRANGKFAQKLAWPCIKDLVTNATALPGRTLLRGFTLPGSHAWRLLELLASQRITLAHLQPSLDNVVAQLGMRRRLE